MGKRKNHKHDKRKSKRRVVDDDAASEDEIDAFHRKRDVIPLDINGDAAESVEDAEHPVFNLEGIDDEDDDEDIHDTGFAAKSKKYVLRFARQLKFLREKFGGVEDEMHEDEDEAVEKQKTVWGGRKSIYYGADNCDFEIEKNQGLTRHRKKLTKNPRKKYKLKFKDAANRHKG